MTVSMGHCNQQNAPQHRRIPGVSVGKRKTFAELEVEAARQKEAELQEAALRSHVRQHKHHAERPDKLSRYAGVTPSRNAWSATLRHKPSGIVGGKGWLGNFATEAQAATAHDLMAIACYGAAAMTNHPPFRYEGVLTEKAKDILKTAFAEDGRATRKQARRALAWLVCQAEKRRRA